MVVEHSPFNIFENLIKFSFIQGSRKHSVCCKGTFLHTQTFTDKLLWWRELGGWGVGGGCCPAGEAQRGWLLDGSQRGGQHGGAAASSTSGCQWRYERGGDGSPSPPRLPPPSPPPSASQWRCPWRFRLPDVRSIQTEHFLKSAFYSVKAIIITDLANATLRQKPWKQADTPIWIMGFDFNNLIVWLQINLICDAQKDLNS